MSVVAIRDVMTETHCWPATVLRANPDALCVEITGGRTVEATKAVSCWVEPLVGDEVLLCCIEPARRYYVLAVLQRKDAALPLEVVAPAGLRITTDKQFAIDAQSIDITASRTALLKADDMQLIFRELSAIGQKIVARSESLRAVARNASSLFDRIHSRFGRSYKVVSELEHTSAKQLNYQVAGTFSLHSKNGIVTTEDLLKFDGKLMQLG
ncbi:MAG: hypothetical protein RL701_633 [Pseudomonadota bacterium]|jgi:hypothetical protein